MHSSVDVEAKGTGAKDVSLPALIVLTIGLLVVAGGRSVSAQTWEPAEARLMTRWADEVSPETVQDRPYPRPQMRRDRWKTLNGLWDFAVTGEEARAPSAFEGEILVPFPIESPLSGVGQRIDPEEKLLYRRSFEVPSGWRDDRILLHFGAVDWQATIQVNGQVVGRHKGGYDPFSVDVTSALEEEGPQQLTVRVTDPTDHGPQPRGKQVLNPGGIWYTAVTGIWQTVWLEPVSTEGHVQDVTLKPDVESEVLRLTVAASDEDLEVEAIARDASGTEVGRATGAVATPIEVPIPNAHLWSPSDPYLYDLELRLTRNGTTLDVVKSYFGMRSVGLGEGPDGKTRITLNGEPLFQYGPLDQGYWPDGLYTAPTAEALAYDLEATKEMGFNMVRKHVKVEPRRWYYVADSLGLLVWQDMPSSITGPESTPDLERTPEDEQQFEAELQEMVDDFYNHPSIVMWIVFNEGWGQYDTPRLTRMVEAKDSTRLVSNASGWTDRGVGHIRDVHAYPGPGAPAAEEDRAIVLGEFGGRGLPRAGHTWQDEENWGHAGTTETPPQLMEVYRSQLESLRPLIDEPGLSGAVYTQTTDVEVEVNGLMTYDRDVRKLNTHRLARLNRRLYEEPPPEVRTVVPTARQEPQPWRYTTASPPEAWAAPDFDATKWAEGVGGFGQEETPGAHVGTEWATSDLWMRRTFTAEGDSAQTLQLRVHHDDAATVYLNGTQIAHLDGFTSGYRSVTLGAEARQALQEGTNTLAIHAHQEEGGQYIDAGLVEVVER